MAGDKHRSGKRIRLRQPEHSKQKVTQTAREAEALALRTSGMAFEAIAAQMGFRTRAGAYQAVQRALRKTIQEPADEVRQQELSRLDRMLLGIWQSATTTSPQQLEALDRVLKIMDRRCYYITGLKVPDRIAPTTPDGEQPYNPQMAATEFAALMAQLGQRYAGTEPATIPSTTPSAAPAE